MQANGKINISHQIGLILREFNLKCLGIYFLCYSVQIPLNRKINHKRYTATTAEVDKIEIQINLKLIN